MIKRGKTSKNITVPQKRFSTYQFWLKSSFLFLPQQSNVNAITQSIPSNLTQHFQITVNELRVKRKIMTLSLIFRQARYWWENKVISHEMTYSVHKMMVKGCLSINNTGNFWKYSTKETTGN